MIQTRLKEEINPVCKSLITTYVKQMENGIKAGRKEYISLGVDGSVEEYRSTFLDTLGDYLESKEVKVQSGTENSVMEETKRIWEETLLLNGQYKTLTKHKNLIYTICENIIDKIIKGVTG